MSDEINLTLSNKDRDIFLDTLKNPPKANDELKKAMKKEPTVIILAGEPCSGKSTVCAQFPDYIRINQDELGSRKKCIKVFKLLAEQKKNIIVDRCNHTRNQRAIWIDLAMEYNYNKIHCFRLVSDIHTLNNRIKERENHPTIQKWLAPEIKSDIIMKFLNEFEEPSLDEGFDSVVFKRTD